MTVIYFLSSLTLKLIKIRDVFITFLTHIISACDYLLTKYIALCKDCHEE